MDTEKPWQSRDGFDIMKGTSELRGNGMNRTGWIGWIVCMALVGHGTPAIAAALPDLTVTVQANPIAGTTKVDFVVTVKNLSAVAPALPSNAPSGFFDLVGFSDSDGTPDAATMAPDGELMLWAGIGLAPNQQYSTVWTVDYQVPGFYNAWVMVDSISFYTGLENAGLPETTKDNNIVGPIPITIESTSSDPLPDLEISDASVAVMDQSANFILTVQNVGTLDADYFNVDVRLNTPNGECPPPSWLSNPVTEFGDVFKAVPSGLAMNKTVLVDFSATELSPGDYKACAAVDLDNTIEESKEGNNFYGVIPFTIEKEVVVGVPDLVATLKQVSSNDGTVTFTVEVVNASNAESGPFAMDLYYHSLTAPAPGQPIDQSFPIAGLAAGESWIKTHQYENAPAGTFKAWLWADRLNTVNESDDANNVDGPVGYQTLATGDLPDLIVEDVTTTVLDDSILYEVTVRNAGAAPANGIDVDIFYSLDSNPDCNDLTGDLASAPHDYDMIFVLEPGNQMTLQFEWLVPPTGSHSAWVKLDCLGNIPETDETNNDHGPTTAAYEFIPSQGPDLAIADFKTKVDCTTIHYLAVVRNVGDESVGAFQVDIFKDYLDIPSFGNPGDLTFYYDGLEPNEEVLVETRWEEVPSGSYSAWVVADTMKTVTEASEGNNIGGPREPLIDAEQCACQDNIPITSASPCACGALTYYEGFCCDGEWGTEAMDKCGDSPGDEGLPPDAADAGDTGQPDVDAAGTHGTVDSTGNQTWSVEASGCTATTHPRQSEPIGILFALLLIGLITRRQTATEHSNG